MIFIMGKMMESITFAHPGPHEDHLVMNSYY
jgi:hypothetical protein